MRFEIQALFDAASVFGGKLASPMQCRLALGGGYYLIYIDLAARAGQPALDVFDVLNEAFDTGLPTNTLLVEDAGFFTYAKNGPAQSTTPLARAFPETPIPADVANRAFPQGGKTSFWLRMRLHKVALFGSLVQVGADSDADAELALYAVLDPALGAKEALRRGTYTARLPDFMLLHLFSFSGVTLRYRFDAAATYSLEGTLTIDPFQDGHACTFHGAVASNGTLLQACLAATDAAGTVAAPFGGQMRGVSFGHLVFGAHYTFATQTQKSSGNYRIAGSVEYGSLALSGAIHLRDTKPVLATVAIDQDLRLSTVLAESVGGTPWPATLFDIVFRKGSSLYFHAPEQAGEAMVPVDFPCPVDGRIQPWPPAGEQIVYQPGFNLHARFDLTLVSTLHVEGDVRIADGGASADIRLTEPVSLFVVQLTGGVGGGGPGFRFSSADRSMGFQCGVLFFQKDFGVNVSLSATKSAGGNLRLTGTLASTRSFAPVFPSPPSLRFSYSKDEGFSITDWPDFAFDNGGKEVIDFARQLQELSSAGKAGCGALGDFISNNLVKTTFHISPSFATETNPPPGKDALYFCLGGRYDLSCAGQVFATLDFPGMVRFRLPDSLNLDDLPQAIAEALAGAAASFVKGLLANADALATFLALKAGTAAAGYAATLACQGLAEGAAVAATEAAAGALGGAAAGAAAVAAAAAAASSSSSGSSCFIGGTLVAMADGGQRPIDTIRGGEFVLGAGGGRNRVRGMETPLLGARRLYAFNGGRAFVTAEHPFMTADGWKAIDPEATRRENPGLTVGRLQAGDILAHHGDNNGVALGRIDGFAAPASTRLYNLLLEGEHSYYADGYLVHNKGHSPAGHPDAPGGLACGYADGKLTLSWRTATDASGYRVTLLGPDGRPLQQPREVGYGTTSLSIARPPAMAPGLYTWQVASTSGDFASAPATITQVCLATPTLDTRLNGATEADVALALTWTPVEGAASYLPTLDRDGTPLPLAAVDAPQLGTSFAFGDHPPGVYRFALRAFGAPPVIAGDASAPQVWTRLASPGAVQASYLDGVIGVHWAPVAGIGRYQLSLYDASQKLVYQGSDSAGKGEARIALPDPIRSGNYRLYLNSMPDDQPGQPGQRQVPGPRTAPVTIVVQLTPEQLAAQAFRTHLDGPACAAVLLAAYPALEAAAMAAAMANAGYPASTTAQGLKSAYPALDASALTAALLAAYGRASSLDQLAAQARAAGKDGATAGGDLIGAYPAATDLAIGLALKRAGYPPAQTGAGIHAALPETTATRLTAVLIQLYG